MIKRLALYESAGFDPHRNLAIEQHLLETVQPGQCILYLWQNENTVVIGRNQNPWKECHTALLKQEGGHLARRLSGGGAVFHDLGNLNFTFLLPQGDFDTQKQLSVIAEALAGFGISTEISGRNDLLADGRKFSGNAYYKNGTLAYHHGTILVEADMEKLGRYLSPSKAKLQSKGVDSVRSRVINLRQLCPGLTVPALKKALTAAFSRVYDQSVTILQDDALDENRIESLTRRNRSWDWNFGQRLPFSAEFEERFPWGSVQIQLQIDTGVIRAAKVYTDAMDDSLAPAVEVSLNGCTFEAGAMERCLRSAVPDVAGDLCGLLCQ